MTLLAGTKLGPYEIVATAGAGGMGEVYRARDTRLDRTVAIKILPARLSASGDLQQRFEREARAISALNHPHICRLYDIGQQGDVSFLVMEYLEGETVAERLAKGRLRLGEALKIAVETAAALESAHRQGMIHRDLKPANIMLTATGAKLMDFGLAKPLTLAAATVAAGPVTPSSPTNLVASLASPASPLTAEGMVLGTFQYLAPEVLEGSEADARSDIFSFGCVLYEMVTGRRAFEGKSQLSVMTAILEHEPPPITAIVASAPPALDYTIRTCLAKKPEERFQTAHDLGLQLKWLMQSGSQVVPMSSRPAKRTRDRMWLAGAVIAIGMLALLLGFSLRRPPQVASVTRFTVAAPENTAFAGPMVVSPDGQKLAFVATNQAGVDQIWMRSLNSLQPEILPGTDGAGYPFWSPDSAHLGFFADGKLKTIALAGGPSLLLCDVADARGGAWNQDGVIVFAPNSASGLSRIAATGGPVTEATIRDQGDEMTHRWPAFLPDQHHFVFFVYGKPEVSGVYVGELGSKQKKKIVSADLFGGTVAPGYLLYGRDKVLMAQHFDEKTLQLTGDATPISTVWYDIGTVGLTAYSASQTGVLAYRAGGQAQSRLTWVDRAGRAVGSVSAPGAFTEPMLSPDGKKVAVSLGEAMSIVDLATGIATRFTFEPAGEPAWSPDGKWIAFSSNHGHWDIYQKLASNAGPEQPAFESSNSKYLDDWSPDGRYLITEQVDPKTRFDLWLVPMSGDRKPQPYLVTAANEFQARFSPDGQWLAYVSDESGRAEIYVRDFPAGASKYQVSSDGGAQPQWSADGRELYYVAFNKKLMAVPLTSAGGNFQSGVPQPLFQLHAAGLADQRNYYAVTKDHDRFLVVAPYDPDAKPISVVLNWSAELKK